MTINSSNKLDEKGKKEQIKNKIYQKEVELDDIYNELSILEDIISSNPKEDNKALVSSVEKLTNKKQQLKFEVKFLYKML